MVQRTGPQAKTDDLAFPICVKLMIPHHDRALWWGLSDRLEVWLREISPLRCVKHSGGWTLGGEAMALDFRTLEDAQASRGGVPRARAGGRGGVGGVLLAGGRGQAEHPPLGSVRLIRPHAARRQRHDLEKKAGAMPEPVRAFPADPPAGAIDCLLQLDEDWCVIALDQCARDRLGMGDEEIGRHIWDLFPLSSQTDLPLILARATEDGGGPEYFNFYGRELGSWFQVTVERNASGIAITFRDMAKVPGSGLSPDAPSLNRSQLDLIADEMHRLADEIGRGTVLASLPTAPARSQSWSDARLAQIAEMIYRDRRARAKTLPIKSNEPQWDILLDLFIQGGRANPVSVTSACIAADVPSTTALRALNQLTEAGLITRRQDARDSRRSWVELTDKGRVAMRGYLRHSLMGQFRSASGGG